MFSENKKKKSGIQATNQKNTITKGTSITGDIISDGDFRVEGTIHGTIKTPGRIILGKTGVIDGSLEAANADIEGRFSGKLILSGTLSLKTTAHVEGEVEVCKFSVEPGATFNATCVMKGSAKELENTSNLKSSQANGASIKKGQLA